MTNEELLKGKVAFCRSYIMNGRLDSHIGLKVRKSKKTPYSQYFLRVLYSKKMDCAVAGLWPVLDEPYELAENDEFLKLATIYGKINRYEMYHTHNFFPYALVFFENNNTTYKFIARFDDWTFELTKGEGMTYLEDVILSNVYL